MFVSSHFQRPPFRETARHAFAGLFDSQALSGLHFFDPHEADGAEAAHAADLADRLVLLVDDGVTGSDGRTRFRNFPERQNPFPDDPGVMRSSGQLLADVAPLKNSESSLEFNIQCLGHLLYKETLNCRQ